MSGPMRGAMRMQQAPAERSRDFRGTAVRLVGRLTPQRGLTTAVIVLGVFGIAIGVIGPRILGHATDLLFNGVIGRQLPVGITREQAIAAARDRGDNTFADLLSGMNVIPGHGVDFGAVARTLLLALVLYLVAALLVWIQARLLNVAVQRTMVALRADVEDKVHRLPLSHFDSRQRGELLSRVTNDIDNIQTSVSITISQLLTSVLTVFAVLVMMLTISPLLTLITVVTVPLSLWVTRAIARRSQKMFVAQWRNTGRLNAHIEETYSGFTVVRTFGHRTAARAQFSDLNDDVFHAAFGAQFFSGLVSPATMFVGNLSYIGVAVVGGLQVATGQITLGSIQAFIQYVRQFNQPLTQVAGMYNTLQSGVASAERVFEFLDEPEESGDPRLFAAGFRERTAGGVPECQLRLPRGHTGARGHLAGRRTGQHGGDRRADRRREDHSGQPADAVLRAGLRAHPDRRRRHDDGQPAVDALADRDGAAGHLVVQRNDRRQHRLWAARCRPRRGARGGRGGLRRPVRARAARRLRHRGQRRRRQRQRRGEAVDHDRAGDPGRAAAADPRRGHQFGGHPHRVADSAGDGRISPGSNEFHHCASSFDDPRRGSDRGVGRRTDRRAGHPRRTADAPGRLLGDGPG